MNALAVKRAGDLDDSAEQPGRLIEDLWADQAVGILGGEPKCCKSFLALDMAVSVASGTACRRRFRALRTAPVLLFPAEDSMRGGRQRLESIRAAANTRLDLLPIFVITAPRLLLDLPRETVARINPPLLILDPFIRLHRSDENASKLPCNNCESSAACAPPPSVKQSPSSKAGETSGTAQAAIPKPRTNTGEPFLFPRSL
ncbi:MAG: hypothetical protein AUK55_07980 [Syntrophobacteraceae bacterium CG2_30_61_12]|nr:MAG: hypothetical protein AUK55_07980 [Syntrophobacteraceae bacterium CG2_30_61_12]